MWWTQTFKWCLKILTSCAWMTWIMLTAVGVGTTVIACVPSVTWTIPHTIIIIKAPTITTACIFFTREHIYIKKVLVRSLCTYTCLSCRCTNPHHDCSVWDCIICNNTVIAIYHAIFNNWPQAYIITHDWRLVTSCPPIRQITQKNIKILKFKFID